MPSLDVSFLLSDPMFQEAFTVTRTAEGVDNNGMVTKTITTLNLKGVINIGSIEPIALKSQEEFSKKCIEVFCQTKLYDVTNGYLPDIVSFKNNNYVVKKVYDWSSYGKGYYVADCEMQDLATAQ